MKVAAVNRSALAALSNGKIGVERELSALFRRVNDEDVNALYQAISEGNTTGAAHSAHRISGASSMIGAIGLASVCARLETAGRAGDLDAVKAGVPAFQQELQRVYTILDSI